MRFITTAIAWIIAFSLTALTVWIIGEDPLFVLQVLTTSAFGSLENISYTLFYATPLLLTGAAVALALEAGLFNIGAEGQLYMGALFAAAWGALTYDWLPSESFTFLSFIVLSLGILFSFLGGALWGGIAGYLKTKRETHEVIATIMLNFIAAAFTNWAILHVLKNPETQNPETVWIATSLRIPKLWLHTTPSLIGALLIAVFTLWAIKKTWWGFRIRATGQNETAAQTAGISTSRTGLLAMAASGGIAGLVGFHEVFGHSYRLVDSFSPGYGFTGLAIALLARGNAINLIFSAILFGALQKGALDLDIETEKVSRDLSAVIQALILVALAAQPWLAPRISKVSLLKLLGRKAHG